MENIDSLVPDNSSTETVDDLVQTFPVQESKPIPVSASVNQDAVLSLLSGEAEKVVSNFQTMQQERAMGMSSLEDRIRSQVQERTRQKDYERGVLPTLYDPDVSLEEKQAVLNAYKESKKSPDAIEILTIESLEESSEGETIDAEDARISLANDAFVRFNESRAREQAIVNDFRSEVEAKNSIMSTVAAVGQEFLPLAEGVKQAKFMNRFSEALSQRPSMDSYLKAFFRPGATVEDWREQYVSMTTADREVFIQTLVDTVKDSNGVLFSTDSQYAALEMLDKITGDYDKIDAAFDTAVNVLDMFGIGWALKAAVKGKKTTEAVVEGSEAVKSTITSHRVPEEINVGKVNPNEAAIQELYKKKEELLANQSPLAPKGTIDAAKAEIETINPAIAEAKAQFSKEAKRIQVVKGVSRKQAESEARKNLGSQVDSLEARKARLEKIVSDNAAAQKQMDVIKGVEEQIYKLEKTPSTDGIVRINPIMEAIYRNERNAVVGWENPSSVGSIFYRTNPEKARKALAMVFDSQSDEVAMALFGMNRQQAIASAFMPKVLTVANVVPARPVDVMGAISRGFLDEVKEVVKRNASTELTAEEQIRGADKILNDFKNHTGIKAFDGMDGFSFKHEEGEVVISSIYGSPSGPFSTPEVAMQKVKQAFAAYGDVTDNAVLMKLDGVNYIPVKLEDVKGQKGAYTVQVNVTKDVNRADVQAVGPLDEFKKKWNFLDRVPIFVGDKQGSLTRHLFPAGAIFDKFLTSSAAQSGAMTAKLEKTLQGKIESISKSLGRLKKENKETLINYWVEANEKGIPLSVSDLNARGFTPAMKQIAQDWREYQDAVYYLENLDAVKTLRNTGYQLLDNGKDRLFAKPISKNIGEAKGYNPDTGAIEMLNREQLDALYDKGGTIAKLRSPMKVDGVDVENILVSGSGDNFLRNFADGDTILNYREGYYHVNYNNSLFIDEILPDGKRVTVATAQDRLQAKTFTDASPDKKYVVRPDKKTLAGQREDIWDVNYQGGRTAQRRRGEGLVDADGSNRLTRLGHVDGPIESALRAATSVAGRTMFRDLIDTLKARALQQHADVFPRSEGMVQFPSSIADISDMGNPYSKAARDARTDFEYIQYLENGYANSLDNMFKSFFNVMAEVTGETAAKTGSKAIAATERGIRGVAKAGVTSIAKGMAFTTYLALNPLRQWIVQPAQVIRMLAYDPIGFPKAYGLMNEFALAVVSGKTMTKQGAGFAKWVDESGILDSVDKSNLVRNSMLTSGEQSATWDKTGGRVTNIARTFGYDFGEKINLLGHMAAVYGKYVSEGRDVTKAATSTEMIGKVRAMSYDMAFEGDMPYNQNWMASVVQFLQVPHKAVMQFSDNRLTRAERSRLVVGDLLLYGGLGSAVSYGYSGLFGDEFEDDHPEVAKALQDGALQYVANAALSDIFEEDVELDIQGSLSPLDFGGYSKLAESMLTDGGLLEALSNTPSGQLLFKDGNRIQKAIMSVGRLVGFLPDSELNPSDITGTLNDIARISSGWTNAEKAYLAYTTQKVLTKSGQTLIDGVNVGEAVGMVFGFPPKELAKYYEDAMSLSEDKKAWEDAARKSIRAAIEVAVGKTYAGMEDPKTREIVNSLLLKDFREKGEEFYRIYNQELRYALQDPRVDLRGEIIKHMGLEQIDDVVNMARRNLPESYYESLLQYRKDILNKGE